MAQTIAVTGGSGFIAAWMIKTLLQKGYNVKASVLDLDDPKEVDHLVALDGAKERLKLFQANLLDEGSFDALIQGADGVFHMASPFFFETKDPQNELLDPALKGTLNVLRSVAKVPTVKRVVLTSSEAATTFNYTKLRPDLVIDETWWSDEEYLKEIKNWYMLSKLIAEKAAWEFCKEKGIDMVTVNPAAVLGPLLHPRLNTSCGFIYNLINGKDSYPNETCGFVNVRNVVEAHILAYETPSANGRYLMVEKVAHYSEVIEILRKLYPHFKLPEKPANDKPFTPTYQVSTKRAEGLGVKFIPFEQSVKETVDSLVARGLVTGQPALK
jgi:nucleoside-diphosphate-sugar epimerase